MPRDVAILPSATASRRAEMNVSGFPSWYGPIDPTRVPSAVLAEKPTVIKLIASRPLLPSEAAFSDRKAADLAASGDHVTSVSIEVNFAEAEALPGVFALRPK